jgi:hypothetical protein
MLIYVPLAVVEELGELSPAVAMTAEVMADCALDIVFAVLQIALFLYYWEKRQAESAAEPSTSPETPASQDVFTDAAPQQSEIQDDGNPYRPPQT